MDKTYNYEKLLIVVALVLCAGVIFYNAFFVPEISIPTVVYIDPPSENATNEAASSDNETSTSEKSQNAAKVNINTASEDELAEKLPGVGPAMAKKIVDNRPYLSIDELKEISGIGDKTFEKLQDLVCI